VQRAVVEFGMPSSFERQTLRRAVAGIVRDTRRAVGWTQAQLGERAGVSRGLVASVETARVNASIDATAALLDTLGLRYELVATAPFLADRRRQREPAHGLCSAYVARRLGSVGWIVRREVEVVHGRSHGWIDVLAFDQASGTILVIEVKTEIDDLGRIERTLAWYEREAWMAARAFGWNARREASALVLLATDANERRLIEHRDVLATALPVRADQLAAGVAGPANLSRGPALALIDPRSRRREWLMKARIDGRRSSAPYADYADFMRSVRRR
jgi:transcriptional regulator with XRE-family HTH domain